jgi:RES domain-containing protein
VRFYRLCKRKYSPTVLSGQGALLVSGRWHSAGVPIVYCASSEALAVIEMRVNVGRFVPKEPFTMHAIEIAEELVDQFPLGRLPTNWHSVPPGLETQRIGDAWLASSTSLAMRVPSIHSRSDYTVLVNPGNASAPEIHVAASWPYDFDKRLLGD